MSEIIEVYKKFFPVNNLMANMHIIDGVTLTIFSDKTFTVSSIKESRIGIQQSELYIAMKQLEVIAIQWAVRAVKMNFINEKFLIAGL